MLREGFCKQIRINKSVSLSKEYRKKRRKGNKEEQKRKKENEYAYLYKEARKNQGYPFRVEAE